MPNPIGLFIQAQGVGDKAALIEHCRKADYATVSVMDDFELCRQIKNALPDCVVVYRDSTFKPLPSLNYDQMFRKFISGIQSQDKRIVLMVNCEDGFSADHCAMWTWMMQNADGWKLCVGNPSSGSVKSGQGDDPNDWLNAGKGLLRALNDHPGNVVGFHEYTLPFAWAVSNGEYGSPYYAPNELDWSKPQWHIGRNVQGIQAACKALGIKPPQCIVTEGLIDTMNDVVAHFGLKADGYRQLENQWMQWYGKDSGDVLADMHIWAWEKVYAPCKFVIGTHTFCYSDTAAQLWTNYRVDNNPRYLARMESYRPNAPAPIEPPKPTFKFYPADFDTRAVNVTITPALGLGANVRTEPSLKSAIVLTLTQAESGKGLPLGDLSVDELTALSESIEDRSGFWLPVRLRGVYGYVHTTAARVDRDYSKERGRYKLTMEIKGLDLSPEEMADLRDSLTVTFTKE